ncbi:5-methylcytosine-specific restriction enzyme B [Legionella pneumophila]|uniref:McrB family protein n=1 Tax=Legionella pneumophila TaxID=446 RepID=UPI000770A6CA|nr:AAA family ATPase [Legionella pneumophila]MDI9824478.1 AAA family ATPase [Legionella pneumophila]CZP77071.1 5-methylcytosine-specific restriction enzyme B [Legionella pneumophila]HDV5821455.1 AAA family ATPase [Legionella pneumophila]
MIYSYLNTLLEKWLEWSEGFLNEIPTGPENDVNYYLGTSKSDNPSRAKEFMRLGFLIKPLTASEEGFSLLRQGRHVHSDLGYIAYLLQKANTKFPGNHKIDNSISALHVLCMLKQYEDFNNVKISLTSIIIFLLKNFPISGNVEPSEHLRYLSAAMFCELAHNKQYIYDCMVKGTKPVLKLVEQKTYTIRSTFSNTSDIEKAIENKISLVGILSEKGSLFLIGNSRGHHPRGLFYIGFANYKKVFEHYAEIELQSISNSEFKFLYTDDNEYSEFIQPVFQVMKKYNLHIEYEKMLKTLEEGCLESLRLLDWLKQSPVSLASSAAKGINKIIYGAPGTGKTYKIKELIKDVPQDRIERVTFHPEYDYSSFVGSYKPVMEKNNSGEEEIKYKFSPQIFINIFVKSWKDLDNDHYLVIEEINRGNCAEIFGDIFQLLDRDPDYAVTPSLEILNYLKQELKDSGKDGIKGNKIYLPPNLHIFATMNTSDQSLIPMDSAFKRRWAWEYVPICYESVYPNGSKNNSYDFYININEREKFSWVKFIEAVNNRIKDNPHLGMDKCIGNYFVKPEDNRISLEDFINKVLFYLWSDVFKDEEDSIFVDGLTFEDFFPMDSNGEKAIKNLVKGLNIEIEDLV